MKGTKKKFTEILILFCLLSFMGCGETEEDRIRKEKEKELVKEAINMVIRTENKEKLDAIADDLIISLKDSSWKTRHYAAETLGRIKSIKAIDPLILALKDKEPGVREMAAWALGEIKSEKAVKALTQAIKDENSSVSNAAKDAIDKIHGLL